MPSRQAPARPRRPMRRMQRTRLSVSPMARAAAAVPSGELSSTNTTSQSQDARRRASRSTRIGILARSLKVGTTMLSSGAGRTVALSSARAALPANLPAECRLSPIETMPAGLSISAHLLLYPRGHATSFCTFWKHGLPILSQIGRLRLARREYDVDRRTRSHRATSSRFAGIRSTVSSPAGQSFRSGTCRGHDRAFALVAFVVAVDALRTSSRWRRWTCILMPSEAIALGAAFCLWLQASADDGMAVRCCGLRSFRASNGRWIS